MPSKQLLKYLKTGKDIEQRGIRFYTKALKQVVDPNSKGLLRFLISEEKRHLDYLKSIEKSLNDSVELPKVNKIKNPVFSKKAYSKIRDKANAISIFNTALEMEVESMEFYMKAAKEVKDRKLKSFLNKLAKWEMGHSKIIKKHEDAIYDFLYWEVRGQGRIEM
ncbi:MAG: ferritin family protein [Candidatus Woesearchaeota archaeon]